VDAGAAVSDFADPMNGSTQADGSWRRPPSAFRHRIGDHASYPPARGRYHLYISRNCPWSHRAALVWELKQLHGIVGMDVLYWRRSSENLWVFAPQAPGCTADSVGNAGTIRDVYLRAHPDYTGRFTVPVLYDRKTDTIVNNESADIIELFNTAFDAWSPAAGLDFAPPALCAEIDAVNAWTYPMLNNGVYRAGFADTQAAYERAVREVFEGLDRLERRLVGRRFVCGDRLTLADIRLYPTLVRFDPVYTIRFKCNLRWLETGYPQIWRYLRRLYQMPGFAASTDLMHIKQGYFGRSGSGIVPKGWDRDYLDRLAAAPAA